MSALQSLPISETNRREAKRFFKFALVGIAGMVTHLTIFNILRVVLPRTFPGGPLLQQLFPSGLPSALVANAIGFTAAVIQNFMLNRRWTFPESRTRHAGAQLGQFALVSVIGLAINLVVFTLVSYVVTPIFTSMIPNEQLAHALSDNFALASAILVVLFWNFTVNRLWTFRHAA